MTFWAACWIRATVARPAPEHKAYSRAVVPLLSSIAAGSRDADRSTSIDAC